MPTVEELDALDQVPAPVPQARPRRLTVDVLDSLDEPPSLPSRIGQAARGLFEAAVPSPRGVLEAAAKIPKPLTPEVPSQAEIRQAEPGALLATGFERPPTRIAPIGIRPPSEAPPEGIPTAEEAGQRIRETPLAERLFRELGVPTAEAAAALELPQSRQPSAELRRAGSVVVPPRTALESLTQSKPLEAYGVGIGQSIEGLLAKAVVPSLSGAGPRDYDPTLLDQAFETLGSLFTPLSVVTFIAGQVPGTFGIRKLAEAAIKRYGPEAIGTALRTLGQQVAGAATSFGSFNAVQDVLKQTGAVRTGEQKAFKPGETAKEAGKGLVTGAALGLAGVPITSPLLRKAADAGVLATVPPLLEGRAPGVEDLLNAGVLVGTLSVANKVSGQLAGALAKARAARTPQEQAQVDAIPEPIQQEIAQEVLAKASEPTEPQPPPGAAPVVELRPTGGQIYPPERIPASFRTYIESQGKRWPLTVADPDFLRLRTEYDALRQPLYEKRGAQVVNRGTSEVVATLANGAMAQLEANRLNAARLRPQAQAVPTTAPAPEGPAPAKPEAVAPPTEAPAEVPRAEVVSPSPALPESVPAGRIAPTGEAVPAEQIAAGREQQIRVPAGRKYRIRYEVVDAQTLIPSNNPHTFARTPGYPEGVQNRPYETDRAEQTKVIRQAQDFEPLFLVSPQPSSGGTPIVAPGTNFVLSGNSRTMSLLRTLGTPKYEAYRQALAQIAPAVGITPEQIASVRNPVLVRRLIGEKDTPDFYRRFAKETNESFKQALSQEAAAVSQGQAVSPATLDYIAGQLDALGPEASLRQLFGANRDRDIIRRFLQDGVITERDASRYVDARTGLLNDEGKRLVENSLLGSAVQDTTLLQVAPDQALGKIGRSLGEIAKVRARGGEWDLSRPLTEALRELTEARAAGMPLEEFRRQQSLLEAEPMDPRSGRLADALAAMPPTQFRQAMRIYAADAIRDVAGQQAMRFAKPTGPDQAFSEAFGAAPAEAPVGVAEPFPPAPVAPIKPTARRVASEAGMPLRTSPIESLEGTQPLAGPSQTSVQPSTSSELMRATVPPSDTGLESSSRRVGMADPTFPGRIIFQPTEDVNALIERAGANRVAFDERLQEIVAEVPGARFNASRVKSPERALNKIEHKGVRADTLSDYLAGRISVDRVEDGQRVLELLNRRFGIIDDNNFVNQPIDGYRARHVQVRLPDGMTAEVQIAPREIQEVQDLAHRQYEVIREPRASLEAIAAAKAESTRIFDEAWMRYQARVAQESRRVVEKAEPTFGGLYQAGREFLARGRAMAFGEETAAFAPAAPFYSALQRTLEAKLPASALPGHIRAVAQGAKAEEVKWSGLDDYLTKLPPGQKVTKTQVLDFLRQNEIQVQDVTKGQEKPITDKQLRRVELLDQEGENRVLTDEENRFLDEMRGRGRGGTKFASYTLPGGQNYTELLLQWANPPSGAADKRSFSAIVRGEGGPTPELFRASHWEEPNVLAHIRFDDRTDAEGKRVLFIEELQSDWHQEGRRKGYQIRLEDVRVQQNEEFGTWEAIAPDGRKAGGYKDAEQAHRVGGAFLVQEGLRIPTAPFAKTWHELALKRMLRWAAEEGYDKLAWTTGEQQTDRYNLANHITRISYKPKGDSTLLWVEAKDGNMIQSELAERFQFPFDEEAAAVAVPNQRLDAIFGKDMANKIMAGRGRDRPTSKEAEALIEFESGEKVLEGLDLKIGGEGMRAFYDQIVPNFLNQYGKKWGARVGIVEILGEQNLRNRAMGISTKGGAKKIAVPSLDITSAMKRAVLKEGQALFERPPTYAVREGVKAPEAQQLAFEALKDTDQAGKRVQSVAGKLEGGVRTLGVGITSDLVMRQRVDLRGRVVTTARDLAQLAQVYRDPRYETFRVFYTDAEGKILAHEGITSRLPGAAPVFIGGGEFSAKDLLAKTQLGFREVPDRELPRDVYEVRNRMRRLGATGYWLLHNHPSGAPLASHGDRLMTMLFARTIPGFKGHIIIDSGRYGLIQMFESRPQVEVPQQSVHKLPLTQDRLLTPSIPNQFLGEKLTKGDDLAWLGQALKAPEGFVTLLYRSSQGEVRAIQEVPGGLFVRTKEMADYLRGRQGEFGAQDVLAYLENPSQDIVNSALGLVQDQSLRDFGYSVAGQKRSVAQALGPLTGLGVQERKAPIIRVEEEKRYFGRAEQAKERLQVEEDKLPPPGREPEDIRPDVFRRLVEVGGAHYEEGARDFPAWSERMKADLGDPIEPYLQRVWDELQREKGRAATPTGDFVAPQGPAEPPTTRPPLTEERVTSPTFKHAALAAEEAMRAVGIARDKEAFPRVSDQLADVLGRGQADLGEFLPILDRHGLTIADFLEQMFRPGFSEAGRTMQVLSVVERRFNLLEEELRRAKTGERPLTAEEKAARLGQAGRLLRLARELDEGVRLTAWYRRADNLRRGLLVSQLATAVRNFTTQVGRLGLDVADAALQRKLQQLFGQEVTADPAEAMGALAETFRQFRPEKFSAKRDAVDQILEAFPREWDRLFGTYMSDMLARAREQGIDLKGADRTWARLEDLVAKLNIANRFQEYIVRRAVFQATLEGRLARRGLNLEALVQHPPDWATVDPARLGRLSRESKLAGDAYVRDLRAAIDHALEITFASRPKPGTIGWDFVRAVNKAPFLATGVLPFPRFMVNSIRFLYEFSPLGFLKLLSPAERLAFQQGDTKAISRAMIGTALFLSAFAIRTLQGDDTKWYQIKTPDGGTLDIRPFNPFAAYLFAAELARRVGTGTLYQKTDMKDLLTGFLSVNVRAGLGLYALEKLLDGLRAESHTDKLIRTIQTGAGELFSSYLVPLLQIRDLFGQFDQRFAVVRNTREQPFVGSFKEKIPGAAEGLIPGVEPVPPRYLPTRAGEQERQQPLLRQVTGAILNPPKNAAERELARFQFDLREIQPSVGDPKADNLVAKHLGQLVEERLVPYVESARYQRLPPAAQGNALRLRLRPLRAIAKARARREEPELFKGLREERRPGRERLYREERQRTREERQAAQPEPEAALVGAGEED